jgi:uncharacterized phage-associated protein
VFNAEKVAQIAAYLLAKEGGTAPYLKLLKLMYLADRESLRTRTFTISGDKAVSMPHGPVLSQTYELMAGSARSDEWDAWIAPCERYDLCRSEASSGRQPNELSVSDMAILDDVHARFGHLNKWQLRDWTHENCEEWIDPNGSSAPIDPFATFRALGFAEEEARARADAYNERRALSAVLSRYP